MLVVPAVIDRWFWVWLVLAAFLALWIAFNVWQFRRTGKFLILPDNPSAHSSDEWGSSKKTLYIVTGLRVLGIIACLAGSVSRLFVH